jgi:hypothetical protein
MITDQIKQLEADLEEALNDESTFEQADKMYNQKFRGQPFPAKELFDSLVEDCEEYVEDEFEYEVGVPYSEGLMIVELCNYKGEGVGFASLEEAKDYPVFVGKSNSQELFS